VYPYTLAVAGESLSAEKRGVLVRTDWSLTFFPSECDPRENPERWRLLADGPAAVRVEQPLLQLPFGWGGPADVISAADAAAQLPNDHFGLIARTELALPAGKWRVATRSDDGVRVRIDDEVVIENWTWHGPTVDAGTVELAAPQTVSIVVEYFELDGYALLEFSLEPMP
jgi:hypothetical protein